LPPAPPPSRAPLRPGLPRAPAPGRTRRPLHPRHPRHPHHARRLRRLRRLRRAAVPAPPLRHPHAPSRSPHPCPVCRLRGPRAGARAGLRALDLSPSELQSALAGAIGSGFDAPVVLVASAAAHDLRDGLPLCLAGAPLAQMAASYTLTLAVDHYAFGA